MRHMRKLGYSVVLRDKSSVTLNCNNKDDRARAAFWYLVGFSAASRTHSCEVDWKGKIRDVRLILEHGEQLYSFITNRKWLLFYFQQPALKSIRFLRKALSRLFDWFAENASGEWTIRVQNVVHAERLAEYLSWLR